MSKTNSKHLAHLRAIREAFCEQYGVLAPFEAVEQNKVSITEWCSLIHKDQELSRVTNQQEFTFD